MAVQAGPQSIADAAEYLQAHLDQPLRCEAVARRVGLSFHRFHRQFRAVVGEPPWAHLRRLRLERAALLLVISDARVCQIALEVGYETHEAFTRAFRSHFGLSPRGYRAEHSRSHLAVPADVEVVERRAQRIAYVRHVGPYHDGGAAFERLEAWATRSGVRDTPLAVTVYWDDQRITSAQRTRCDAAWVVDSCVAGDGDVRIGALRGGAYAVARLTEPYDVSDAWRTYDELYQRVLRSSTWRLASAPPFEVRGEGAGTRIHVPLERARGT